MTLVKFFKDRFLSVLREDEGADTFEYMLVIGAIAVAVVLAAVTLANPLVQNVCDAVAAEVLQVMNATVSTC